MIFSIPFSEVKGIESGSVFLAAKMFGTGHNDSIINKEEKTLTNNAVGIVGGISNRNDLIFRIAIKQTSSTPKIQAIYNWKINQIESLSIKGKHDLCVVLRIPVIIKAVTTIVLANFMLLEQKNKPCL